MPVHDCTVNHLKIIPLTVRLKLTAKICGRVSSGGTLLLYDCISCKHTVNTELIVGVHK